MTGEFGKSEHETLQALFYQGMATPLISPRQLQKKFERLFVDLLLGLDHFHHLF